MRNLAERIDAVQPTLEYGLVVDEGEGQWMVAAGNSLYRAKTAASCFMKPEKNDMVLVSMDCEGCCYILSILERPPGEKKPATLSFEGHVNLEVRGGALRVLAHDGIAFTTPGKTAFTSRDLEINALNGKAHIESMSFLGRVFDGRVEKMKMIADAVDTFVRRAVERLGSSYRYVKEHEEIQSRSTRMLVDGTLSVQTKNTVHTAEGHVKIDAEQIHLG